MVAKKKSRRIKPIELLEMIDFEERKALASEIGLTPPENLNDQAFASSIAEFSATTLLRTIVRLRSPVIEMLKEVYQFLEKEEARGRTTVRAVILPGAKDDLQVLFNSALKEAIATAFDRRIMSFSIDLLEKKARDLSRLIITHMNDICTARVRYPTERSLAMREYPPYEFMARRYDRITDIYHPIDYEYILAYYRDFEQYVEKFDSISRDVRNSDWPFARTAEKVLQELREGMEVIQSKLRDMERRRLPGLRALGTSMGGNPRA